MSSLDTGYVSREPATDEQRAFARALGLIMRGQHDDAALTMDSIGAVTGDTMIRAASRVLLTAMLQYQHKWKLLAELSSRTKADTSTDLDRDKAGVESWASAFRSVPARVIAFPSGPEEVPLLLSPTGAPMIPVVINGRERYFWLDTGSSLSILASNVADELGIKPLLRDTLEVVTTTGRVAAQPAAIGRLQIGRIRISNATAMIVSSDLLRVSVGDGGGPAVTVQIEGVIGFDIISQMDLRIDYVNRRVTLIAPVRNARLPRTGRNLFWVGIPIVRLVTSKGVPLHFNLDTGAQETYSTQGLITKTRAKTFSAERRLVGGIAGIRVVHGTFIDQVRVTMGGQPVLLRKLLVFAPAFSSFVTMDGILGSDIGRGGLVRIDATNGLFLLVPTRPDRGLRIEG